MFSACKQASSKPLTRGVYAARLACGPQPLTTDLTLLTKKMLLQTASPLHTLPFYSPRSPPSTLCLSIIKVGIDPFTILSLSGCSHKAKTFLPSLDRWHLSALSPCFWARVWARNEFFVCLFVWASLIIFNWNRQRGPGRNTGRFIKHLYALIAFEKWFASILSSVQWGAFFWGGLFCFVLFCDTSEPKKLACQLPG